MIPSVDLLSRTMSHLLTLLILNMIIFCKSDNRWIPIESQRNVRTRKDVTYSNAGESVTSDTVDLHHKDFCVDVSTYEPVVWVVRESKECKTEFVKQCEEKSEEVCADVHETRCEVSLVIFDDTKSYFK